MQRACDDLVERLAVVERHFDHAVSLFSGDERVSQSLQQGGKVGRITRIEADSGLLGSSQGAVEPGEIISIDEGSADLVVSLFSLHEINDVPGLLAQIKRSLKPDGLFLAAFSGAGTLGELRQSLITAETEQSGGATARVYPFMDVREAGALLQRAGFALPVADIETIVARYGSAIDLMRDLRAMGAASAMVDRSRQFMTRKILDRACDIYAKHHSDADGRLRATFNVIWISGWSPHHSQQKPLKPGSATTYLGEALLDIESSREKK